MKQIILEKLFEIEKNENVKIILAVESGSRAWGFASPNSDFDVRFIYMRPKEKYLQLENRRDVIELPIDDVLDINGWDLDKTLRLLHRFNPTLFEWFSSPIVYLQTDFALRLRAVQEKYFSVKSGTNHYLNMAAKNYREYLHRDKVPAKKYFYVLRPILACRWILAYRTPPPMLFSELMYDQLDAALIPEVERLLDIKMYKPENREIPRVCALNDYLDASFGELKERIAEIPQEPEKGWEELNALFLNALDGNAAV